MKKLSLLLLTFSLFACVTAPPAGKEWSWIPDDALVVGTFDTSFLTHPGMKKALWSQIFPNTDETIPNLKFIEDNLGVKLNQLDRVTFGIVDTDMAKDPEPVLVFRFKESEGWFESLKTAMRLEEVQEGNFKIWSIGGMGAYRSGPYLVMASKENLLPLLTKTSLGWGATALKTYSGDALAVAFKLPSKWQEMMPKALKNLGEMILSVKVDSGIRTEFMADLGDPELAMALKDLSEGLEKLGKGANRVLKVFLFSGDIPEGPLKTLLALYSESLDLTLKTTTEVQGNRFTTSSFVGFDKIEELTGKAMNLLKGDSGLSPLDALKDLEDLFNPFKRKEITDYNNDDYNDDYNDEPQILEDLEGEKSSEENNSQDQKGEKVAP